MNFRDFRGIRSLKLAVLKTDTLESLTYDTPVDFAGAESVGQELEESTGIKHYDNQPAIATDSEGADKYKIVTSVLENIVKAKIEGRKFDEENNAYFGTPKNKPYVALGFVAEDTNGDEWYYWVYKNKITGGGETHNTKDDGTDTTNLEWEATSIYTQHKFTSAEGKPLKYYYMKAGGKVTEENFFKTVYDPDKAVAMSTKGEKTDKAVAVSTKDKKTDKAVAVSTKGEKTDKAEE